MKLTRVYPDAKGNFALPAGSYGQDRDGCWWIRPPGAGAGILHEHKITEHEDGTITAHPSIIMGDVHGWLICGEWKA